MPNVQKSLFLLSGCCAVLSAVTTIGIHGFIASPSTFEESLTMYRTWEYMAGKWWVILHCLLVITSVYGLYQWLSFRKSAFAGLGFTFYTAFGLTEILRMLLVLFYLRELRDQFIASEGSIKEVIMVSLNSFAGISEALFAAFTIFLLLGNFFAGMACMQHTKKVRMLGISLLLWSALLLISLINNELEVGWIASMIGYVNLVFQPLVRLWMGVILIGLSMEKEAELDSEIISVR